MPDQVSKAIGHVGGWRTECHDCGAVVFESKPTIPFECRCQVSEDVLRELSMTASRAAFELKEANAEDDLARSRMAQSEARYLRATSAYHEARKALVDHLDGLAKSNR